MVAAGHFTSNALKNEWAVYRQIFYRELSETEYNQIFQDISHRHSIQEYRDLLYRVSEEIAWYLYQRDNENLLVPDSEIKRIIGELDISEGERKTVERCFALCGYWKANTGRGCVEFYHNNIRDFFLCEKLMRELNRAYEDYGDALRDEHRDITPFLRRLCELFQYGKLEKTVLFFIRQRAAYADKEPDLCVDTEREQHHTARIFENLLFRGDCYSVCLGQTEKENPVKTVAHILGNTVALYRHIYEPLLNDGEYIRWWTNAEAVNKDGTFHQLATEILEYAGSSDLHGTNLRSADLHGASLEGANLTDANLHGVDLGGKNLRRVDLRSADLYGANLHGADLQGAQMQDADLQGADLQGADLYGADLQGAKLYRVNLRDAHFLCHAHLHYAHLRYADLHGADLRYADLQGADLRGADLRGADLRGADLRGADLQGAYLRDAKLRDAKLHYADFRSADLHGADLQSADLRGTKLQGADLRGAKDYNLDGAIGAPITD